MIILLSTMLKRDIKCIYFFPTHTYMYACLHVCMHVYAFKKMLKAFSKTKNSFDEFLCNSHIMTLKI